MFRITGSLVQCLAKNYRNDSVVSVDIDMVGVMAAYCNPLCVCVVHCIGRKALHITTHTHNRSEYAAITPTLSISTDTIESFL